MTSLKEFLDARRTINLDSNILGMGKNDIGKYIVSDEDYDIFLNLLHDNVFIKKSNRSTLMEKHRSVGPILVNLDLRYNLDQPLLRRFTNEHIRTFIAEYAAAMIYFSKVTQDLFFYQLQKPGPENLRKNSQKDGVHIQCPNVTTTPEYQYGIRGFLLSQTILDRVFYGESAIANLSEDCFDASVIHRNNWFIYGAGKPDLPPYQVEKIWKVSVLDINDHMSFREIVEKVVLHEVPVPSNLELVKTLSIRRGHIEPTPLGIRDARIGEWEELINSWVEGKATA